MRTFEEDLEYLKCRPIFLMAGSDNEDDCHKLMTAIFREYLKRAGTEDFPAIIELYEKWYIKIETNDYGFDLKICKPSEAPQLSRNHFF